MSDERRLTRAERRQILRVLQESGMCRADARRRLYGPTWKTKHPTRRDVLAEACRANARKAREQEADDARSEG